MGHKYTKILPVDDEEGASSTSSVPALYLGSIDYILEDQILSDLRVRCIVSALPHAPALMPEIMERHEIEPRDFVLKPLEDSVSEYISLFDPPDILSVVEFIHERRRAGKTVLVHCDAGITRSPTVVIAYIMRFGLDLAHPQMTTYQAAVEHVRSLRQSLDVVLFSSELRLLADRFSAMTTTTTTTTTTSTSDSPPFRHRILATPASPEEESSPPVTPTRSSSEATVGYVASSHHHRSSSIPATLDLKTLQETWQVIRECDGGAGEFGRQFYARLLERGGARARHLFRHTHMATQASLMTKMVAQLICGVSERDTARLARAHAKVKLASQDFDDFREAMLESLAAAAGASSRWTEAMGAAWRQFLDHVFDVWKAASILSNDSNGNNSEASSPTTITTTAETAPNPNPPTTGSELPPVNTAALSPPTTKSGMKFRPNLKVKPIT